MVNRQDHTDAKIQIAMLLTRKEDLIINANRLI